MHEFINYFNYINLLLSIFIPIFFWIIKRWVDHSLKFIDELKENIDKLESEIISVRIKLERLKEYKDSAKEFEDRILDDLNDIKQRLSRIEGKYEERFKK